MSIDQKTGFTGILSNVAEMQAPPGALLRAENVVIRRTGSVEQRPGVGMQKTLVLTSDQVHRIIPVGVNNILAFAETGAGMRWWDYDVDTEIRYSDPDANLTSPDVFRGDLIPSAKARGNLYVGCRDGVVKWTAAGSSFETAGVPLLFSVAAALATGTFFANASHVAYSVVGVKTDANGLVTRSRPTGALYVDNATGSARAVTITITSDMAPGEAIDTYEIYRSRVFPAAVTPDAEMQLVGVVTFAASVTYTDDNADSARGATLYTSPSRDGAEGANDRPPACGAMATFKGATFFGNTVGPRRRVFSFLMNSITALSGIAAGVGYRTATATTTAASANLTLVSATTGLKKGMRISGTNIAPGAYITNISGATVTMSAVATGSAAGLVFTFVDSISIDGGATWSPVLTSFSLTGDYGSLYSGVDSFAYRITPAIGGFSRTFVAESFLRGPAAVLELKATHGSEYFPALPEYDDPADEGDQDILPNGLSWSKTDEPEHVPPVNFAYVGDTKSDILALCGTRDALFIFKEDGIWRLTGTAGKWRIDPFDPTTKCILPSSVVPLNNRIYALTNKGVVAVSDNGVQGVSNAIGDQLKSLIYTLASEGAAGAGYYIHGPGGDAALGYAATANERDSEYMLLIAEMIEDGPSTITGILVYNEGTQAWTSWDFSTRGAAATKVSTLAWNDRLNTVLFGQYDAPEVVKGLAVPGLETSADVNDAPYASDGEQGVTISAVVGLTATYSPAYDLEIGDVIVDTDGVAHVVTATPDTTHATLSTAPATGSAVAIRPFTCAVEPRAFMTPNQVMKHWSQLNAEFGFLYGATQARSRCRSTVKIGSAVAYVATVLPVPKIDGVAAFYQGASIRSLLPTAAARGWSLRARIEWDMIYGAASLESIFAETVPGSTNKPNLAVGT